MTRSDSLASRVMNTNLCARYPTLPPSSRFWYSFLSPNTKPTSANLQRYPVVRQFLSCCKEYNLPWLGKQSKRVAVASDSLDHAQTSTTDIGSVLYVR